MTVMLAVVLTVPLAGCVPQGESVSITYHGSINATDTQFTMEGFLSSGGGIPDRDRYRNVRVTLYSINGTVISSQSLGNLPANYGSRNVSITTSRIPQYVVFESPDFWTEQMQVEYYVNADGEYRIEYATARSELPVETG